MKSKKQVYHHSPQFSNFLDVWFASILAAPQFPGMKIQDSQTQRAKGIDDLQILIQKALNGNRI